jgi:hypothetical protein
MKSWSRHFHTLAEIKIQHLLENLGGKRLFGRPRHRQETLNWILEKQDVWVSTRFIWPACKPVTDTCECINYPSDSTKCGNF